MSHRLLSFVSESSQLLLILATMDGGYGYCISYGGYGGYRSYGGYGGYGYGKREAEATADAEPGYGIYGLSSDGRQKAELYLVELLIFN